MYEAFLDCCRPDAQALLATDCPDFNESLLIFLPTTPSGKIEGARTRTRQGVSGHLTNTDNRLLASAIRIA
eukprot:7563805-Pyramimonas_sp.AAC.1